MTHQVNIPCPVCQTNIPVVVNALIGGMQFTCSNCQAMIGMEQEGRKTAEKAFKKYQELQKISHNLQNQS